MGAHMEDASSKPLKVSNSISLIKANKMSWIDSDSTNGWLNLGSKNKLFRLKQCIHNYHYHICFMSPVQHNAWSRVRLHLYRG